MELVDSMNLLLINDLRRLLKVTGLDLICVSRKHGNQRSEASLASPLIDDVRNQPSPTSLVRGPESFSGVSVEILVEE